MFSIPHLIGALFVLLGTSIFISSRTLLVRNNGLPHEQPIARFGIAAWIVLFCAVILQSVPRLIALLAPLQVEHDMSPASLGRYGDFIPAVPYILLACVATSVFMAVHAVFMAAKPSQIVRVKLESDLSVHEVYLRCRDIFAEIPGSQFFRSDSTKRTLATVVNREEGSLWAFLGCMVSTNAAGGTVIALSSQPVPILHPRPHPHWPAGELATLVSRLTVDQGSDPHAD